MDKNYFSHLTPLPLSEIPNLPVNEWRQNILQHISEEWRLKALFAVKDTLYAIVSKAEEGKFVAFATEVKKTNPASATNVKKEYPALAADCPQAQAFERALAEETETVPIGHPWLKPLRFSGAHSKIGQTDFFQIQGDGNCEPVHDVAVGPVHAGIIEPGHFRFQCFGEEVQHLEISLGYQHRGIERHLVGGPAASAPNKRTIHYMETAAGDTSVGHATAYCQLIEALLQHEVSSNTHIMRAIALELERLANHTGDLGALANDVGYLPTASYCGRLRGDFLNLSASLCGNRLGRNFIRPGGINIVNVKQSVLSKHGSVDENQVVQKYKNIVPKLHEIFPNLQAAIELLWNTPSVMSRFEHIGILTKQDCISLGIVGVAARAAGINEDVRKDFPYGAYKEFPIKIARRITGDVYARAYVRWMEIQESIRYIEKLSSHISLQHDETPVDIAALMPNALVVSQVEGWRGPITHVAITDQKGKFKAYKIYDPSFHNWMGLAIALRGQQISDFPLCNKSFNLSYCGHDL